MWKWRSSWVPRLVVLLVLVPAAGPLAAQTTIETIILTGQPLPLLGPADAFSLADVNDNGLVVFYGRDVASTCGAFAGNAGGGPPGAVITDGFATPQGPLYLCNSLSEAPLANNTDEVAIAVDIGIAGSPRAIYVSPVPGSAAKVVMENETAPDGGSFGRPTLLDFNDGGNVLFHAPVNGGPYPEAFFLGDRTGGPIAKVVAVGDALPGDAGGGAVIVLGDASMNNAGDVVFDASVTGGTQGEQAIFLVAGGVPSWVVGEGDAWKLGTPYSGGEEHKGRRRFVDTFTSVRTPRVNDPGQVNYYATTAGGEQGFFIATAGSEYTQSKVAAEDDPSVVGIHGFNGFGPGGRHGFDNDGNLVQQGDGGDPVEVVLVFPWFETVAIDGELIPGGGDTFLGFVQPAISESTGAVAFKAGTASGSDGVFGGFVDLDDDDGDGLLDTWEESGGWDSNNDGTVDLDLYGMGARKDHKDIFVEVDYMDCTVDGSDCPDTHDHKPTAGIIEDGVAGQTCDDGVDNGPDGLTDTDDPDCAVVAAFDDAPLSNPDETQGIHLHVLVDEALPHSLHMNFAGAVIFEDTNGPTPGTCFDGDDNGNDGSCDTGGCPQVPPPPPFMPADADCNAEDPGVGLAAGNACNDGIDNGNDGFCDTGGGCGGDPPLPADPDCLMADFDDVKSFGTAADRSDPNSTKILAAKGKIFHYAIYAHSLQPDNVDPGGLLREDTISGYGEMPGNDFIVALGERAATADQQEGTFMHELGHNLGLDHGGNDSMNYKPNYLSVMNYSFQMTSIVPDRPLDYSRWALPPVDNEDGAGPGTCTDGQDNGDNDGADGADQDCWGSLPEGTLDERRGIDSDQPPGGLVSADLTTAYTYRRDVDGDAGDLCDCPFVRAPAVGDINWNMSTVGGVPTIETNVPQAIADPDSRWSPSEETWCAGPSANLVGFNDWVNLVYIVNGLSVSPDASFDGDHFTQPPEPGHSSLPDSDDDGVADIADNCHDESNPDQQDGDGDSVGDECDNCPEHSNPGQEDFDDDGSGDACDADDDGDGVPDVQDADPLDPYVCRDADSDTCDDCSSGTDDPANDGPDFDLDGLCDAGDPDDDNDGVPDAQDADPLDPHVCRDVDGDTCDDCSMGTDDPANDGPDFDLDGLCDAGDPDDDDDGVPDTVDCAPLDGTIWMIPQSVGSTLAWSGKVSLSWSPIAQASAYDVYRGTLSGTGGFSYQHSCHEDNSPDTSTTDDEELPSGGRYYLVCGVNSCGDGPLGASSGGSPRPNPEPCGLP
jgi:hypothetical protein